MPIFDYHCHLPPADLAGDVRFRSIAHVWLGGDHYKWRAMRANGVPEEDITGREPGFRTFLAWARTVPYLVGNPLHHWTHLELRRHFGITELLCEASAARIWEACNAALARPEFSARAILARMRVRVVCTTDDPVDGLEHHRTCQATRRPGDPLVVPGFRPDRATAVADPSAWNGYLERLGRAADLPIDTYPDLVAALERRHAAFHDLGCRCSDHALAAAPVPPPRPRALDGIFARLRAGRGVSPDEAEGFRSALLLDLGRMDARSGWAMQVHLGALRDLNSRRFAQLGRDAGLDAVNDPRIAAGLSGFLDALDRDGLLPKMVVYTLNPAHYEVLGTVLGCFQEGPQPGRMQLGAAWWFNDHIEGMRRQLAAQANLGLLSRSVGMLTDSRSFLSFPRHEYFRRVLCALVGGWVEAGEAPADFAALGAMVQDICYRNARGYFAVPGAEA
jgi:glucuronate isomerase